MGWVVGEIEEVRIIVSTEFFVVNLPKLVNPTIISTRLEVIIVNVYWIQNCLFGIVCQWQIWFKIDYSCIIKGQIWTIRKNSDRKLNIFHNRTTCIFFNCNDEPVLLVIVISIDTISRIHVWCMRKVQPNLHASCVFDWYMRVIISYPISIILAFKRERWRTGSIITCIKRIVSIIGLAITHCSSSHIKDFHFRWIIWVRPRIVSGGNCSSCGIYSFYLWIRENSCWSMNFIRWMRTVSTCIPK